MHNFSHKSQHKPRDFGVYPLYEIASGFALCSIKKLRLKEAEIAEIAMPDLVQNGVVKFCTWFLP